MAGTKFSDYLGLKHYKKAKKLKHFIHLNLATRPQSLSTYHSISVIFMSFLNPTCHFRATATATTMLMNQNFEVDK